MFLLSLGYSEGEEGIPRVAVCLFCTISASIVRCEPCEGSGSFGSTVVNGSLLVGRENLQSDPWIAEEAHIGPCEAICGSRVTLS